MFRKYLPLAALMTLIVLQTSTHADDATGAARTEEPKPVVVYQSLYQQIGSPYYPYAYGYAYSAYGYYPPTTSPRTFFVYGAAYNSYPPMYFPPLPGVQVSATYFSITVGGNNLPQYPAGLVIGMPPPPQFTPPPPPWNGIGPPDNLPRERIPMPKVPPEPLQKNEPPLGSMQLRSVAVPPEKSN